MRAFLRDAAIIAGCFGLMIAPVYIRPASAYDMSGNSPAYQNPNYQSTQNYQATQPDTGRIPMHPYYTGNAEYVVNPLEMTNTRDNRGNIPNGSNSISNYREYRASPENWSSPCERDPNGSCTR